VETGIEIKKELEKKEENGKAKEAQRQQEAQPLGPRRPREAEQAQQWPTPRLPASQRAIVIFSPTADSSASPVIPTLVLPLLFQKLSTND